MQHSNPVANGLIGLEDIPSSMAHCPICRGEENERVFTEETEVRGKRYTYEVCYCPRCGVKFTFFTPFEEAQPAETS